MKERCDGLYSGGYPMGGMPMRTAPGRPDDIFRSLHDGIVRASHEAIVTVDEQQRIVMLNPAAQRMFGTTPAQALGSNLSRFIPPELRDAHAAQVRAFGASGTAERPMAERGSVVGMRANGERFAAEATISRLDVASEFGERHFFTAQLRDVSAMRGLKAEVDAMKQRMREIFDLAPVAIWITENERVVFANHACDSLFGAVDGNSLVGRSVYELLSAESHESLRLNMALALAGRLIHTPLTERIARLDGGTRLVDIALSPLWGEGQALQMVFTDVTEKIRVAQELERSSQELRQLAANLVSTREEERLRIARELHDELGQRLSALQMELAGLAPSLPTGGAELMHSLLAMVDDTIASVRRISSELRPLMLDDLGLNAALEWLVDNWKRHTNIPVTLHLCDENPPLDDKATIALYRIVQEALANVARHAHASAVTISFRREPCRLCLTIEDNGAGYPAAAVGRAGAHGLLGIRERVYMLGGSLDIANGPGGGAQLVIRVPLSPVPK